MQTLSADYDYQVAKTLTPLKQEDVTLNSKTQTREKWDSLVLSRGDFSMIRTCNGIPCFIFYFFCLETTL